MRQVAIVFHSKSGHTRKIAEYMRDKLLEQGHGVSVVDVSREGHAPQLEEAMDTVIVGGPVYSHKFPKSLVQWIRDNKDRLEGKTTAFFSVSLNAVDTRERARDADDTLLRQFLKETHWTPVYIASLGGALKYLDYGWFKRWLMKRISRASGGPTDTSRNYEFTNWSFVDSFLQAVVHREQNSLFLTARRIPESELMKRFVA